jgi:hypothetical protein
MQTSIRLAVASVLFLGGVLALSGPASRSLAAQDKAEKAEKKEKKRKKAKANEKKAEPAPASPQAGPEHALLKQFEGDWTPRPPCTRRPGTRPSPASRPTPSPAAGCG